MPKWTPEQERAINESGQNIIVSAGAGSGKTAVLSERVLTKIESGIHINELLILTFTKAAASEMKERIRNKLSSDPKYKDEVKMIDSSFITTFDSYALSIVKKYNYLLNVPSNISISDESLITIKAKEIMDDIFERLYDSHNSNFENLIDTFCIKNDKDLRSNILKVSLSISSKINALEYINNIRDNFFNEENINKIYNSYLELLDNKRREIRIILDNLGNYLDSKNYEKFLNSFSNILSANKNEMYLYKSIEMPRGVRYPDEESKLVKEELKDSKDELVSLLEYGSFDDIKSSILETKNNVLTILDIVEEFTQKLKQFKIENDIYTFSDIASLSIKVLSENKDALDEVKYSFKEIMIDEYQDTDNIQDAFIKLIENNNVYMVGDIKQSIYKFRGSNPNIFKSKYDKYSSNDSGLKIDLIKNFRSRSEVLNSINSIFELLMDDELGGCNYKLSHEMVYGNTIYDDLKDNINYNASILEYNKDEKFTNNEIEMFTIANDIKSKVNSGLLVYDKNTNKMRKCNYSDFVIILDRSKYFTDYKKVFEYVGIPINILRDEKLNDNSDLNIIKNIIDFIIHINSNNFDVSFKYDFVSIARSFLYEYSDDYIFSVIKNNDYINTSIYKDFSSIKSINSITPSELLNTILDITKYYEKIYKVGDYNNTDIRLKTIYDLSNNLGNVGYSISEFKDHLDNIIENGIDISYKSFVESSNSVKIMTVHASKGLEYPICYFADLDHKFNDADLKDKFIVSDNYGLIESNKENVIKLLYKNEYKLADISERLRLFYVALTRAREKIIIVLPYKDTMKLSKNENGVIDNMYRYKYNRLSEFIYSIKDYIPSYFESIDLKNIPISKDYLFKKHNIKKEIKTDETFDVKEISIINNQVEEKHFSKEIDIINKNDLKKLKYGSYVHKYLEYIDFKNYDESKISDNKLAKRITNMLKLDIFKNIDNCTIYKEYEFMYEKDNTKYNGVIDLMIEHDDHIDIIDYKLKNIADDKYKNQLNGYKDYIKSISNKKINLYLYSILDEKLEVL